MGKLSRFFAHEHVRAALLLAVFLAIFHRQVIFFGKTFLMENSTAGMMGWAGPYDYPGPASYPRRPAVDGGAIAWQMEPLDYMARQSWTHGAVPLWEPHVGLGMPDLASGMAGVLDPLQVLFAFFPHAYWALGADLQALLRFFLAGFFTYLFLRELGLKFWPALAAGAAYMCANYLVDYGNHIQMRVDTLLPMVMYAYQRLFQRPGPATYLIAIGAITWSLLADFAESAFMLLSLATLWYFWQAAGKVYAAKPRWPAIKSTAGNWLGVTFLAFLLSAPLLLPFLDNISLSSHSHESGAGNCTWPASFVSLLLVPYNNIPWNTWPAAFSEAHPYFTCPHAPHFYVLIALLAALGVMAGRGHGARRKAVWFFGIYFAVFVLKSYGFPLLTWMGSLPVYERVTIAKYVLPSLEFCLAVLAALGLQHVLEHGLNVRRLLLALGGVAGLVGLSALLAGAPVFVDSKVFNGQLGLALLMAVALVVLAVACRLLHIGGPRTVCALSVLILFEPLVWHRDLSLPERYDPFTPPPFAEFLKKQEQPARVFGGGGLLYPNLAAPLGLDDLRYVTALDSKRREALFRAALTPDLGGVRLTGEEREFYFNQYFDLLNIKYFVAPHGVFPVTTMDFGNHMQAQVVLREGEGYVCESIPAGQARSMYWRVPSAAAHLDFAVCPAELSQATTAGRVSLSVHVRDGGGDQEPFTHTFDLARNVLERKWVHGSVDLAHWRGQNVQVQFVAAAEPEKAARAVYFAGPVVALDDEESAPQDADLLLAMFKQDPLRFPVSPLHYEPLNPCAALRLATVSGVGRSAAVLAPGNRVEVRVRVPRREAALKFAVGLENAGAGAQAYVLARQGTNEEQLYAQILKPAQDAGQRHWIEASVDLSRWAGQQVTLVFMAGQAPPDTPAPVCFADLELSGERTGDLPHFERVYSQEAQIYRNNRALPRAFVVQRVERANDQDEALRRLLQPGFDPRTTAVIEGPLAEEALQRLRENTPLPPEEAEVTGRTSNTLNVRAALGRPGVLVVSEAYMPGWQAWVDGKSAPVLAADVALRGVYLEGGAHEIIFAYRPWSFTAGLWCGLAALAAVVGWIIVSRKRGAVALPPAPVAAAQQTAKAKARVAQGRRK